MHHDASVIKMLMIKMTIVFIVGDFIDYDRGEIVASLCHLEVRIVDFEFSGFTVENHHMSEPVKLPFRDVFLKMCLVF